MTEEERSYKVRLYRLEHGLTQKEFARLAGVSETTIVYIEKKGKRNACKKRYHHQTSEEVAEKIDKIIEEGENK